MTANDLVNKFRQREYDTYCNVGKIDIYIHTVGDCVDVRVNWPGIGSVRHSVAADFAKDLARAADLASECERLLVEAGYRLKDDSTHA